MKKILFLSANPTDTSKLRLDEEVREIQVSLERSKKREQFELITKWALRIDDLRRALLDHDPHIVHFSGHGFRTDGIALENDLGHMQLISTESLAALFELFKDKIECVLLNACYSETQAEAIFKHINCVIGMSNTIQDNAAINFAKAFYDAIGADRGYSDGFKFGRNNIDLNSIPETSVPKINIRLNYPKPMEPHLQEVEKSSKRIKASTFDMQNVQFGGGLTYAETVTAHQLGGNITYQAPEQKQNLTSAAIEIQQLLQQLEQSYPTNTKAEKANFIAKAIEAIENNPTLHTEIIKTLKAGDAEELKAVINHPLGEKLLIQMDE